MELVQQDDGVTYLLDEGDFTFEADKLTRLGEIDGGDYAARIKKYDLVKISTNYDQAVTKISGTSDVVKGIVTSTPEGNLPTADKTAGNYEPRAATVVALKAGKQYSLPIADTNAAIVRGDKLIYDLSLGAFDLATAGDVAGAKVVAEESAGANEGGFIEAEVIGPVTIRA